MCFWVGRAGAVKRESSGAAMQCDCSSGSKRLAAATVNSSLFSSVEKSPHRKKENFSVYSLTLGPLFCFSSFHSVLTEVSPPVNGMVVQSTTMTMPLPDDPGTQLLFFLLCPFSLYMRLRNVEAFYLIIYLSIYHVPCIIRQ